MKTSDEAEQSTNKETLQDKKMRDLLRDGDLKKFDEAIEEEVESEKEKIAVRTPRSPGNRSMP